MDPTEMSSQNFDAYTSREIEDLSLAAPLRSLSYVESLNLYSLADHNPAAAIIVSSMKKRQKELEAMQRRLSNERRQVFKGIDKETVLHQKEYDMLKRLIEKERHGHWPQRTDTNAHRPVCDEPPDLPKSLLSSASYRMQELELKERMSKFLRDRTGSSTHSRHDNSQAELQWRRNSRISGSINNSEKVFSSKAATERQGKTNKTEGSGPAIRLPSLTRLQPSVASVHASTVRGRLSSNTSRATPEIARHSIHEMTTARSISQWQRGGTSALGLRNDRVGMTKRDIVAHNAKNLKWQEMWSSTKRGQFMMNNKNSNNLHLFQPNHAAKSSQMYAHAQTAFSDLDYNPYEMLQCSYLRLTDSKIKDLEAMCENRGLDVSLHPHVKYQDVVQRSSSTDFKRRLPSSLSINSNARDDNTTSRCSAQTPMTTRSPLFPLKHLIKTEHRVDEYKPQRPGRNLQTPGTQSSSSHCYDNVCSIPYTSPSTSADDTLSICSTGSSTSSSYSIPSALNLQIS